MPTVYGCDRIACQAESLHVLKCKENTSVQYLDQISGQVQELEISKVHLYQVVVFQLTFIQNKVNKVNVDLETCRRDA
jgi:hypothetical protein